MKTSPLILLTIGAIFLAGCAATQPPQVDQGAPSQSATATSTPTPVISDETALAEAMEGVMGATVLEVLDPQTFRIEPSLHEQETRGLSGEVTVTIEEDYGLVTPAEGECGYDEAIEFTKQYFIDNPENPYVFEGSFSADLYFEVLMRAGFAYLPDNDGPFAIAQEQGESANAGLYGLCADFGE